MRSHRVRHNLATEQSVLQKRLLSVFLILYMGLGFVKNEKVTIKYDKTLKNLKKDLVLTAASFEANSMCDNDLLNACSTPDTYPDMWVYQPFSGMSTVGQVDSNKHLKSHMYWSHMDTCTLRLMSSRFSFHSWFSFLLYLFSLAQGADCNHIQGLDRKAYHLFALKCLDWIQVAGAKGMCN